MSNQIWINGHHEEAKEIVAKLNSQNEWDAELCARLCWCADMEDEWASADGESFEDVLREACKRLEVEPVC